MDTYTESMLLPHVIDALRRFPQGVTPPLVVSDVQAALKRERSAAMAEQREQYNSTPAIYATVDHNAMSSDRGVIAVGELPNRGDMTYEELIQHRADVLRKAKDATDTLNRERSGYGRVGAGIQTPAQQVHDEYYVADGRRAEQTRHLHGPADELHSLLKQRHIVLQAAGVPPQAIGETPSSERVSGAEASTGHALHAFSQRALHMRNITAHARKAADVELGKRMRPDMFERVFPLLKPESAVEVLSQMFIVTPEDFDVAAVAEEQAARRGGAGGKRKADGETEERKSSYKKQADAESRAEPGT